MHDIEQLIPPSKRPDTFIGNWFIYTCQDIDNHGHVCVTPWQANSDFVSLVEDDIVKKLLDYFKSDGLIFLQKTFPHQLKRKPIME